MTGQMSPEELHAVLDGVRDGDLIEAKRGRWTSSGPVMVDGKRVCGLVMIRYPGGELPTDLVSVRVVERARPDWAADDVAMIYNTTDGDTWIRVNPRATWESSRGPERGVTTDHLVAVLGAADFRVVARFEQAQA